MTKFRVLLAVALMGVSSLAFAQLGPRGWHMGAWRMATALCASVLVLGSGFVLTTDAGGAAAWNTTPLPFATAPFQFQSFAEASLAPSTSEASLR